MNTLKKIFTSFLVCALLTFSVACTVDQALSDIDLLVQTTNVVCTTLGAVSPADAAACSLVTGVASVGLNVIQTDYDAYKANGSQGNLANLLNAISVLKTNLPAELAAAHITDPSAVVRITAWVNLITSTLNAVVSILPKLTPSNQAVFAAALPTPAALQARWTKEVCYGDVACGKLVTPHEVKTHGKFVRTVFHLSK